MHFKEHYIQALILETIFKEHFSPPLIMSIASPAIYIHEPLFQGIYNGNINEQSLCSLPFI